MAFRYEVWKFNPTGIYAGNEDVFFISNYEKLYDVLPNDRDFNLVIEKAQDEVYYRVNATGSLLLSGDYFGIAEEIYSSCDSYILKVYDDCNTVRSSFIKTLFFNDADYIGFIKPRNIEMDFDKCIANISLETFDCYNKFLRNYDEKENVYDITNKVWVKGLHLGSQLLIIAKNGTSYLEFFVRERQTLDAPMPYLDSVLGEDENFGFAYGTRVRVDYELKNGVYYIKDTYAREIVEGEFSGAGCEGGDYSVTIGNETWNSVSYLGGCRWKMARPLGGWDSAYIESKLLYYDDGSVIWILPRKSGIIYPYGQKHRGVLLNSVIKNLRTRADATTSDTGLPAYTTNSQFLFSESHPFDVQYPNRFEQIVMLQKSDAKSTTDSARVLDLSLKDILGALKYFNLYWHIGEQNKLVIEHISYYLNGLSYNTNKVVKYLYTVPEKDMRVVVRYKDGVPQQQDIFELEDSSSKDFVGYPITYAKGCAGIEKNTYQYNITTDVQNVIFSPEEDISNSGIVLVSTQAEEFSFQDENGNMVYDTRFIVRHENGAVSAQPFMNAKLSTANVHDLLWRDNAQTDVGTINDEDVTFDSTAYNKIIQGVPIRMSYKEMNPYYPIKTSVGDAILGSGSYNQVEGRWTMNLEFKTIENE